MPRLRNLASLALPVCLFSRNDNYCCFTVFSQKASQEQQQDGSSATTPLLNNATMVYEGGFDQSEISWATCSHVSQSRAVAGIVGVAMAMWRLSQLY